MRKLHWLFVCLPILFSLQGKATGDSLRYLTPKDTVFLKIDYYGEKVFEHTLEKGQTIFSLSQFYGMKSEEIFFYNPHINPDLISIGDKIKIPIPNKVLIRRPQHERDTLSFTPVYHRIRRGETLYRLSTLYYKIPLDTLKKWNDMENHTVYKDQPIYIGMMNIAGIPDSLRNRKGGFWWKRSYELGKQFRAKGVGKKLKKEKGPAFWNKNEKTNSDDLYALHRTAKPGTLIKVLNPMTRKTIFVKVLGKIPDAKYPPNAKIVLSEKTAKMLGARDPKFYVNIQYWR